MRDKHIFCNIQPLLIPFSDTLYVFSISNTLHNIELKVAMVSFQVCCVYTLLVMSLTVYEQVDVCARYMNIRLVLFSMYWHIYYLNNLIYALRIRQYREAYMELLCSLIPKWFHKPKTEQPWVLKRNIRIYHEILQSQRAEVEATNKNPKSSPQRRNSLPKEIPKLILVTTTWESKVPYPAYQRRRSSSLPTINTKTVQLLSSGFYSLKPDEGMERVASFHSFA